MKTGSCWRHVKRGTLYEIVGLAKMQISTGVNDGVAAGLEKRSFVVYSSLSDGALWVRPETEFCDGRFEEIKI